jgi:LPXTG-motif cell wall-anchored protein
MMSFLGHGLGGFWLDKGKDATLYTAAGLIGWFIVLASAFLFYKRKSRQKSS